jgi:signal transduction histidine kinase
MEWRRPFDRLTITTALALGFSLSFGMWLLAGYQFSLRLAAVQRESVEINARYLQAQELIAAIRSQILLGSVYVRDTLLDPDPASAPEYRRHLERTYRSIDESLNQYVPVIDSEDERQRIARLRSEIDSFRSTILEVLAADTSEALTAHRILQERVVPRREAVVQLSEQFQGLNRAAFVQQQVSLSEIYRQTQRRVWQLLGLALLGSLGVALLATRHAGRLESRLRRQKDREVEYARELQRLSAKLVTAQEEERRTIARELHDEVGQVITAMKVELAVAQRAATPAAAAQSLDNVRALADGALHTVRDLSHLLHPGLLDDLGLPAAIDWQLKEFGRRFGVRTELSAEGLQDRLDPATEATAYRIVQEALTNVARHARAGVCRVTLRRLPDKLLVAVDDDGCGFDPAPSRIGRGLGLIGVRERVAGCRGILHIDSAPGRGTRLTVALPIFQPDVEAPALPTDGPELPRIAHGEVSSG